MKYVFLSSLVACSIFVLTEPVLAQTLADQINQQIGAGANAAEIGRAVPPQIIIAEMIKIFLTLIGTIFMILIIYGGWLLILDKGEGERFERGKKTIRSAVMGVFIVLLAYSITLFVGRSMMASVYGKDYQNRNLKVKCNAVQVFQGNGCDIIRN